MSDHDESQRDYSDPELPWTANVRHLLVEWRDRADATSQTHFAVANQLWARSKALGIPVVVLTAFVGTSVFATLEDVVNTGMRIFAGVAIVLASVLASLQTFLNLGEQAEKNRAAAEDWSAIRREISEMLALHPEHIETHGDPKKYLDGLRTRIDEVSKSSPDMPDSLWLTTLKETRTKNKSMDEVSGTVNPHTSS